METFFLMPFIGRRSPRRDGVVDGPRVRGCPLPPQDTAVFNSWEMTSIDFDHVADLELEESLALGLLISRVFLFSITVAVISGSQLGSRRSCYDYSIFIIALSVTYRRVTSFSLHRWRVRNRDSVMLASNYQKRMSGLAPLLACHPLQSRVAFICAQSVTEGSKRYDSDGFFFRRGPFECDFYLSKQIA